MCGFAGIFDPNNTLDLNRLKNYSYEMCSVLIHRGPDSEGLFHSDNIAIAHRRLSIQDLSIAGNQPMHSKSGRYLIAFNGEIYNHKDLRIELNKEQKIIWESDSDTESLIESISRWGLENTLKKIKGMFAFALWDKKECSLYLVRDRFGEKPLYYGWVDNTIVFASELKAICNDPRFIKRINKKAVSEFFNKSYISAPLSVYKGIFKVEPSTFIKITDKVPLNYPKEPIKPNSNYGNIKVKQFYQVDNIKKVIHNHKDPKNYTKTLEKLIINSLNLQSKADVDLGVLLSGGTDSSIIVSLLQKYSITKVKTFTLGFEECSFDESKKAIQIANVLGTNHNEYIISNKDIESTIPNLSYVYDEPFADSSQIPSYIISSYSSKSIKVLLSGDGGDELFGGYPRYQKAFAQYRLLNLINFKIRKILGVSGELIMKKEIIRNLMYYSQDSNNLKRLSFYLNMLNRIFYRIGNVKSIEDLSKDMNHIWDKPKESNNNNELKNIKLLKDLKKRMMIDDIKEYLPDDLICKMERASMHNSIELRMPFLDTDIVEYALSIPSSIIFKRNEPKYLLKKILEQYLPIELIYGPKKGFSIPLAKMLRNSLRQWANDLINSYDYEEETNISKNLIYKIWEQHLSGNYDRSNKLWTVLMYISWRNSIN